MKRGLMVLSLCAVAFVAYFTSSKWAIHHKTLTFEDPARSDRPVTVDVAVRRDREMEAIADMIELPGSSCILLPGNRQLYVRSCAPDAGSFVQPPCASEPSLC